MNFLSARFKALEIYAIYRVKRRTSCRCISLERGSVGAYLGVPAIRAGLALEAGYVILKSEPQSTI